MISSVMIRADNLNKEYRGFSSTFDRLLVAITLGLYRGARKFQALHKISVELEGNQIVGIIGPNGAGKSTLLRIFSGISRPDEGALQTQGVVRSILELGVGFNAELTGRENIRYNGVLWGYKPALLQRETDAILEFAGLLEFADDPIKVYSTGMQMRLAFSLATHLRADVILVDEALAVGDAAFQQKCMDRFREYRNQGSLIIVVSHDMALVSGIADRVLLLDQGHLVADGRPPEVISQYIQLLAATSFAGGSSTDLAEYNVRLYDSSLLERTTWFCGESGLIEIALKAREELNHLTLGFHVQDARGMHIFGTNSYLLNQTVSLTAGTMHRFRFGIQWNAGPGSYSLGISVHRGRMHTTECYLWTEATLSIQLESRPGQISDGVAFFDPVWMGEQE